ncbi:MAG TPA: hypothetical protein VHZ56_12285 [Devosia sp.]|jgi:hypothetical protein|nr:hypothetical protein [Devosia sp.]
MKTIGDKRRPDLEAPAVERRRDTLGKLVQFENRRKSRSVGLPDRSGSADILIFTGVRYERDTSSAPTKPTATPRTKRKRV